jgi:hypothetical protein
VAQLWPATDVALYLKKGEQAITEILVKMGSNYLKTHHYCREGAFDLLIILVARIPMAYDYGYEVATRPDLEAR